MVDTYKIEFITPENHQRRGVAFLISENRRVTAKSGFDGLNENTERMFRVKFDYWLGGKPYPEGYHGWDKSEFQGRYTKCYVFTHNEKEVAQRLYGFLCNPKPSNPRYHICVLTRHARKTKHETDETDLKIVEEMRTSPAVQKAVKDFFGEKT
jgi:hypothetical protein